MKKIMLCAALLCGVICFSACNSNNQQEGKKEGAKFAPKEKQSSMTQEERAEAIARKKSELTINPYEMMTSNDVKLSILPPQPVGDITEEMAEYIGMKMLQQIAANGIGGLNTVPNFALGATITPGDRKITGTAPQKMITTYTLGYKVMNMVTGDVYAAADEEITGVGGSFEEATRNAVKSIGNTPKMKKLLAVSSKKIIDWFESNLATFKSQVDAAYGKEDYALALALLESVPQKATTAFEYVESRHADVLTKFQEKIAATELAAIRKAIALSPDSIIAEPYAHLQMLPKNSPEYKQAEQLIAEYEAKVTQTRTERIQRQQAKDDAEAARLAAKEEADAQRAHAESMAEIEASKITAKYQAQATEESYKKQLDVQRGFWGNLGARIIEGIDKFADND